MNDLSWEKISAFLNKKGGNDLADKTKNFTLGIIGDDERVHFLGQAAKKLGLKVSIYTPYQNPEVRVAADFVQYGDLNDIETLDAFMSTVDTVIYTSNKLSADAIEFLERKHHIPQASQALYVTQDRMLQKAYLESLSFNIAPFHTIVNKLDIYDAVTSIGYPCVLRNNQPQLLKNRHMVLYEEADIEKTDDFLASGTCVLEAWIPKEQEFTIICAKDSGGQVHPLALSETKHFKDKLTQTQNPPELSEEVAFEMFRIAQTYADQTHMQGVFSIDLFLTTAGVIYVHDVKPFPDKAGNFTLDSSHLSMYEAHVRACLDWPLPQIQHYNPSVTKFFAQAEKEAVIEMARENPDWLVNVYPIQSNPEYAGHVTVLAEDLEDAMTIIEPINQLHTEDKK